MQRWLMCRCTQDALYVSFIVCGSYSRPDDKISSNTSRQKDCLAQGNGLHKTNKRLNFAGETGFDLENLLAFRLSLQILEVQLALHKIR